MGCITGLVAKIFLTGFNIAVTLTGVAVLTLSVIVAAVLHKYDFLVPTEINQILAAMQSVSPLVMGLGLFGVLVSCCCSNKLFLYTYFVLGCCLVVATLTVAGIGLSNINNEQYQKEIRLLMTEDIAKYDLTSPGEYEALSDTIYSENECCGVKSYTDWMSQSPTKLPAGCCRDGKAPCYNLDPTKFYTEGCYDTLITDCGDIAQAVMKLAVFFGVLLFALLTSTCLCVKCTDAMPI